MQIYVDATHQHAFTFFLECADPVESGGIWQVEEDWVLDRLMYQAYEVQWL